MKVILLEKITHLGGLGDLVNVKDGFGRNYLIPQKKAVVANEKNMAEFDARRVELERLANAALETAQTRLETLETLAKVTIHCQASDEGKLYGSIVAKDIAQAINEAGGEVKASEIIFPSEEKRGIRKLGHYHVIVRLHVDVSMTMEVAIVSAEGEAS